MKKITILSLLHLPPPIHGASMACKYFHESTIINNAFDTDYVNLMTAVDLNDSGKFSLKKIFVLFKIIHSVFTYSFKRRYDLCYVTLNTSGPGFYKDFLVILMLKIFRLKIIYHLHNRGISVGNKKWINRLLYKKIFKNTLCILLSPKLYPDIRPYISAKDIFYCPNGIPIIQHTNNVKKPFDEPCRLLFLSNMMEEKGVYILLEACKLLKENYSITFECHFIGAWADISEIQFKDRIIDLDLTNVVFAHGKKYNEEKQFFYENSDIFVFPTYYHNEAFPLVILEAMQFAMPIISTLIGGISDQVIDGKTGYLVSPKNHTLIAEKLHLLISNPVQRKQMGQNGYVHFLENFTLEKYERRLVDIFNEIA